MNLENGYWRLLYFPYEVLYYMEFFVGLKSFNVTSMHNLIRKL